MQASTQLERLRRWLAQGRRQWYAGAGAAIVVLALLVLAFEPSGGVSLGKVQELINSSYNTGSASCAKTSGGHDVCSVATEKCRGTLVVKPVDDEIFTVVSATPSRLRSTEACANPETLTPQ